ncbi:MAG: hypothetical protein L3J65_12185 [Robiginitomaculum sp.]|nr:hypothetical protein [Robiginitomaculum sp.]
MENNLTNNLRHTLKEWTEIDVAAFHLGVALGIIPPLSDEKDIYNFGGKKWMFWSENPLGNLLFDLLENLVKLDILEKHKGDNQLFRWNPSYKWDDL